MRILHVIHSVDPTGGGPIEGLKQLAAVNIQAGHTVEVASLDAPNDPAVRESSLTVHGLGPRWGDYSYSRRLIPWLRGNGARYDVVVVNGIWQYQCFGTWRALRGSRTPYVVFTHGMLDPWFKRAYPLKHVKKWLYWPWADYRALRDAQAVVFTCEEERVLARESFWLYKVREVVVGYGVAGPGPDLTRPRDAFLSRHPETRDKRVALFMGRIHKKKGCDLLIKAFAETLARDPAWHLVIAGPDQSGWQAELKSLICRLGIEQRVTWTGMISGDMKWGAIASAEIFALPSHQENFGLVVAEALACGIPVLISDKVNIWREICADGAGLVASDNLESTSEMLAHWAGMNDSERAHMAAEARPCFLRRFEIHAAGNSLVSVLSAVVAGRDLPEQQECLIATGR